MLCRCQREIEARKERVEEMQSESTERAEQLNKIGRDRAKWTKGHNKALFKKQVRILMRYNRQVAAILGLGLIHVKPCSASISVHSCICALSCYVTF